MILSVYFQIILSLSFSFLLHLFNFKKQLHYFFTLLTTSNATENNNNNNKVNLKFHNRSISSSKPKLSISLPPRPTMQQLIIGCESINEMQVINDSKLTDEIEGDDDCWKRKTKTVEGGVNNNNTFPPPLSSLDCNGKPKFVLLPVRKNGRLQLKKVSVKRSDSMYANREDGRLRLYLVPDQCNYDLEPDQCDIDLEQEEDYSEEEEEEITKVESELLLLSEEEEMVEESRYDEEEDRVREWNNERCRRRCHEQQLVNNIYGSHNNLLVY